MKRPQFKMFLSPFSAMIALVFAVFVWPSIYFINVSRNEARRADAIAASNAQTIANFTKTPFSQITLESIGGLPPQPHVPFVHPCDKIPLVRTVDVSRDTDAMVGRTLNGTTYSHSLPPGLVHFEVKKNPNSMSSVLTIASNWPRYVYLSYDTWLQAIPLASGPAEMPQIKFYIVDAGVILPSPGDPPPKPPLVLGPQPSCPAASIALQSSP